MAGRIIDVNGHCAHSDIKTFILKTVTQVSDLPKYGIRGRLGTELEPEINEPCGIGSKAIVKTGEVYLLWPDNSWGPF